MFLLDCDSLVIRGDLSGWLRRKESREVRVR
jgi:hypothetical protein